MAKHEHRRPSHPAAVRVDTVTQRERARLRAFDVGSTGSESLRSGSPQVPWTGAAGLPPVASSRRCAADLGFSLQLPLPASSVQVVLSGSSWGGASGRDGPRRADPGRYPGKWTRGPLKPPVPRADSGSLKPRLMDLTTLVSGHLRYRSLGSPLIGIQLNRNYGRRSGAWVRNGS